MVNGHDGTNAERWGGALATWEDYMNRKGLADSTRARMAKYVRQFSHETTMGPWEVTAADVTRWLDAHDLTRAGRYARTSAVRSFYRWAVARHRTDTNPLDDGPHPLAGKVPTGWAGALAEYKLWQLSRGVLPGTVKLYKYHVLRLARQTGATSPWTLTGPDLSEWMARQDWARETTRSARSAIRSFYEWAEQRGYVDVSPAESLPSVRVSMGTPRPASEDDYTMALATADDRAYLMLRLAAELGLRRAEVASLHTRDLFTDATANPWIMIHGKGDKDRPIPLPADLARAIRGTGTGYVFPGNDHGHLSAQRVGKLVSDTLPQGVTMHQLRHRFASRAYSASHDLFAVQRLLGHTSPQTTQRYVAITSADLRAAVEATRFTGATL